MQFNGVYFLTAMIMIPINELFVYPIFHHCLPYYKSYNKFIAGAVIRIAKYVTLIALITTSRYQYIMENTESSHHCNATTPCLFEEASSESLNNALDEKWFILPQIISSLSDILILISMCEHYCAQVPYSMKGLAVGCLYTLWSLFIAIGMILSLPFSLTSSWSQGTISCGFWYLLTKLILLLIAGTLVVVAGYRYKQRQREDVLPNEHIFAERYYSK